MDRQGQPEPRTALPRRGTSLEAPVPCRGGCLGARGSILAVQGEVQPEVQSLRRAMQQGHGALAPAWVSEHGDPTHHPAQEAPLAALATGCTARARLDEAHRPCCPGPIPRRHAGGSLRWWPLSCATHGCLRGWHLVVAVTHWRGASESLSPNCRQHHHLQPLLPPEHWHPLPQRARHHWAHPGRHHQRTRWDYPRVHLGAGEVRQQ